MAILVASSFHSLIPMELKEPPEAEVRQQQFWLIVLMFWS